MKLQDLTGQRFGRLLITERGPNQGNRTRWNVHCDCGEERLVQANHLTSGRQVSCGCHRNEQSKRSKNIKHGLFTKDKLNQQGRRAVHLWEQYRLTLDEFEAMKLSQGGVCAICGVEPDEWNVDHDHSCCATYKKTCGECIRGLLCRPCNQGIGFFQDDVERMQAGIAYLQKPR